MQSTKRGGKLFWDFRSFNPPISKNNWANEYADWADAKSNSTLVVSNSYLDVPVDWLSPDFIEDAEELKLKNYRAYEHEYLGIATGTGGDVFANVKEFNAREFVGIYDMYGNIIGKEMRYKSFDHIYCGLDWGKIAQCSSIKRRERMSKRCVA